MFYLMLCRDKCFVAFNPRISQSSMVPQPISFLDIDDFKERAEDKKIISISPGGLGGFYMLGITTYIKENYDISGYQILGASAGAWNSIPMSYKRPINELITDIMSNYCYDMEYYDEYEKKDECDVNEDCSIASIYELQCNMKSLIVSHYDEEDFDLDKVNIATTLFTRKGFKQTILCDISTLEQLTDCCFASSHIPFITGGGILKYDDKIFFDGGLIRFPPEDLDLHFKINTSMWDFKFSDYFKMPSLRLHNDKTTDKTRDKEKEDVMSFENLLMKGYEDSHKNKRILDRYFG